MNFVKMHGIGNDFVVIAGGDAQTGDFTELARSICDRHFGVGADGLIAVLPADNADFTMRIFNSDGSEPEMCGNGVRCAVRFFLDKNKSDLEEVRVDTLAGLRTVSVTRRNGVPCEFTVDMGAPVFQPANIPVDLPGERAMDQPLTVDGVELHVCCVSMGNPHAVVFMDHDISDDDFYRLGPALSAHKAFPRQTNAEFAHVLGKQEIRMRVWERGAGETLACGTGACATLAAAAATDRTGRSATLHLPGGDLNIQWTESDTILMTGPAETVFSGVWTP